MAKSLGDRVHLVIDITGNERGGFGNSFFYLVGQVALDYLERPASTRKEDLVRLFRQQLPGLLPQTVFLEEFHGRTNRGSRPPMPIFRQLEEWRREGRLPFRGLAANEVARIADTLDYPPRGAPTTEAGGPVETPEADGR